jgi:hypothetical protein
MALGHTSSDPVVGWKGWDRMDLSLQGGAGSGWLRVIVTGKFSLAEAQRTFLEMLEAVVRHQTAKVLFDGRALQGEPSTIQRFLYGDFAASAVVRYQRAHGLSRDAQFAYVLHEPVLDPQRFGERGRRAIHAHSSGFDAQYFQ